MASLLCLNDGSRRSCLSWNAHHLVFGLGSRGLSDDKEHAGCPVLRRTVYKVATALALYSLLNQILGVFLLE